MDLIHNKYKDEWQSVEKQQSPPRRMRKQIIVSFDLFKQKIINQDLDFVKVLNKENENIVSEPPIHYASEKMLAKDWLSPEEDKAWKDL